MSEPGPTNPGVRFPPPTLFVVGFLTAILPSRPARTIVATGPYRYWRNPMYVALSAIYIGSSLLMSMAWPLLLLPLVLLGLYALVIRREEHYLGHAFGDEYAAYRSRVRRWL